MVLGALGNKKSLRLPGKSSSSKSHQIHDLNQKQKGRQAEPEKRVWAQEGAGPHRIKQLPLSKPHV